MIYDSNDRYIDELEEENELLRIEIEALKSMIRTLEVTAESVDNIVKDVIREDLFSLRKQMNEIRLQIAAGEKVSDYKLEDMRDWRRWHDAMMVLTEYYFTPDEQREFEIGPDSDVEDSVGC
jgi:hypothetical protein